MYVLLHAIITNQCHLLRSMKCISCLEITNRWQKNQWFETMVYNICHDCHISHVSLMRGHAIYLLENSTMECDFCLFKQVVFQDGMDHLDFENVFKCNDCLVFIEKNKIE